MRLHLVGLAHRDPTERWEPCAYSGKVLRLCRMLDRIGVDVVFYGGPRIDAPVAEHVVVFDDDDRRRWFGHLTDDDICDEFEPEHPAWSKFNARTGLALHELLKPGDLIGLTMGRTQQSIRTEFADRVVCEVGVGYEGVLADTHRCFESEAWRHWVYGRNIIVDGHWYDVVIPNAFDPNDYLPPQADVGDYLLYLGRLTARKGTAVVAEIAKKHKVITAGPGPELEGVEHVGVVRGAMKAALLAGARALLCPTLYIEPFGGVAVEAMLSGVPVLTSPFGAFSETVVDGLSGRRCYTLGEFLDAVDRLGEFDRQAIADYASGRFSLDVVAPQYGRWLDRLSGLYGKGWFG